MAKAKSKKSGLRENIETIFSAILIALIIRIFLVEAYKIPTGSMIPTLIEGDHLLVNKFIYGVRIPILGWKLPAITDPKRGDIVVFHYPKYKSPSAVFEFIDLLTFGLSGLTNTVNDPKNYIKRTIGIPGEIFSFQGQAVSIQRLQKDGSLRKVSFNYLKQVNKKHLLNPLLNIHRTVQPKKPTPYNPLEDSPQKINKKEFETDILQPLKNSVHKAKFLKYYKLNPNSTAYILDADTPYPHKEDMAKVLNEIEYPKKWYKIKAKTKDIVEGANGEIIQVEQFQRDKNSEQFNHVIQITDNDGSFAVDLVYIPKKGDTLEFVLTQNNKQENIILFKVNNHKIKSIPMEKFYGYNGFYDTFYSKVFPKINFDKVKSKKIKIDADFYLMMGDNRDNSSDSRVWGLVHEDYIIGKPLMIYWPPSRMFHTPD